MQVVLNLDLVGVVTFGRHVWALQSLAGQAFAR